MLNLGTVRPGSKIHIPWDSFDGGTGASITMTGIAVTDIEVYKDESITQRSSDNGYALVDTDGIDVDGLTGLHEFTIDLADNSVAGFYSAGSRYVVRVASVTIDAQTVNFTACRFEIGYPDAVLNTTIATLSSQTSFTLTVGPAEDDALNGCVCVIHDVASAIQLGFAVVNDYTGATKTVTLTAGVTFTAAATDNIGFYPPSNMRWNGTVASVGTGTNLTAIPWNAAWDAEVESEVDDALGSGTGTALTAIPWNAAWDAEVQSECADALTAYDPPTRAEATTDVNSVLAVLGTPSDLGGGATIAFNLSDIEAQTDDIGAAGAGLTAADNAIIAVLGTPAGASMSADIAAVKVDTAATLVDTNELQVDWVNGGRLDLILDARASQTSVDTIDDFLDTEIAAILEDSGTTLDDLVDDLEGRLTAALATQLAAHSLGVGRGVVDAASTTTALIMKTVNGAAADATDDHYNGRHVVFTSGALLLQAASITDYVGATKTATISAVTDTPAEDVTFVIV